MLSIVYSSMATTDFTEADLAVLLMNSRANNKRDDLTGMLLYRDGHFLQLLEGPMETVRRRMAIIEADPRHEQVGTLLEEVVQRRHFPTWTMGYETVTDQMADQIPGYRTTFDDIQGATGSPAGGSMLALRQLLEWFQNRSADGQPEKV